MLRRYLAGPTLIRDTARAAAQACDDARMAQVPSAVAQAAVAQAAVAQAAVAQAAGAFGLDAGSLRALGGNSGSAWGAGNRVLRVGRPAVIDAELTASSAAAAVLPVPAVLDRAEVGDVSAVLLEMLPGRPAADFARDSPGRARGAGQACSAVHALLALDEATEDARADGSGQRG